MKVFNTEIPRNIDTVKFLLLDETYNPKTQETPTLKSSIIVYHSLFEVMDKLAIFKRSQTNFLRAVSKNASTSIFYGVLKYYQNF